MDTAYVLQAKGIVKRFPGTLALDQVDLELARGEVLGLIGENGAGKSTLMKIIAGAMHQDAGTIILDGQELPVGLGPKELMEKGISLIYQELNYLDEMTIAENLFLGRTVVKGFFRTVDYAGMGVKARELLCSFNIGHDPFALLKTLSVAEKQMVEILRAVSRDVKVLIMDEPTSSLNEVETRQLFEMIRGLKATGVAIIYISHKLEELAVITDRVQVMRDGRRVASLPMAQTDSTALVELMVGRSVTEMYPKEDVPIGPEILRVEGLNCRMAKDVNLVLRRGEIFGLYGLVGSGCVDVVEGLLGIQPATCVRLVLDGRDGLPGNPIEAKVRGLGYVPSDRKQEGLVLIHPVKDNMTLSILDTLTRGAVLDRKREIAEARTWLDRLQIKAPSIYSVVESLSGGNQQKVVVAKCILADPKVIIMNDPTRGIDVGAKVEIYHLMEELCRRGISIIIVTAELLEAMGITDRLAVMVDGRIAGEFQRQNYDQKEILHLAVRGNGDAITNTCAD